MFNLNILRDLLFGKTTHPDIPNVRADKNDNLNFESLNRGTAVIGKPGSGKTVWAAMQVMNYALEHPDRPVFSLDASGSFTDEFIKLYHQLPRREREKIDRRVVFDRMGDTKWTVPFPFFSEDFGLYSEEQVQRVAKNFKRINETLLSQTPVMGLAISETLPELSRLLCSIKNEHGECWQITEAKKLLLEEDTLQLACKKFGYLVPDAKSYFEREFLGKRINYRERERRTHTLRSVLGSLSSKPIRARLGYYNPGWTPKEAESKGLIVLVSGEELTNQEEAMGYLFTDVFSQVLAMINKRTPHDPDDKPVLMIIDEVPMIIDIRGMAKEVGRVSPQYRSRKLQMVVIFQALWQLAENLREQIWSLGNTVCFGVEDFKEAFSVSQQLFRYDPKKIKFPAAHDSGQPIVDQDRGQYLEGANWVQHLGHRECVMKRYVTEAKEDPFVAHIEKTSEKPDNPLDEPMLEIKERLLRRRAIPMRDALEVINNRKLTKVKPVRPQT